MMRSWLISVVAALLMIGAMTSCSFTLPSTGGQPAVAGNQALIRTLQGMNFGKYLESPRFEPEHTVVQDWDVYTYPTDELRCILGGEYFIIARKGAEADRTVIWFEGGGACYPGREDCTTEARFPRWIEENGLASLDERNPLRTWNFISVPYCDGSIHLGDSDADYNGDGVVDHWHWGLRTTSAAVRLMKKLFPDSQKILIAGVAQGRRHNRDSACGEAAIPGCEALCVECIRYGPDESCHARSAGNGQKNLEHRAVHSG